MHNPRPDSCRGCPFDDFSHGFVPPSGPENSALAFIAEAPAKREVALSQSLVGESGAVMNRIFSWLSTSRDFVRLGNIVNCMYPDGEWHRDPFAPAAINHCHNAHLSKVLAEPHKVIVTLGAIPTKHLLNLDGLDGFSIKDFHGTVHRDPTDSYWIVPTFHPAHLLRGAWNLMGTMLHDIMGALEIVHATNWRPAPDPKLTIDPDPEWWGAWVDQFLELSFSNPGSFWLSVDSETDGKMKRGDEGELKAEDRGGKLVRTNVACGPEEGITVPRHPAWDMHTQRLLASPNPKMLWNGPFDTEVYQQAGMPLQGQLMDFMWGWHALQSDVPRGLGFAAAHYLPWKKAWKHLAGPDPATYAAWDGVNNWVTGMGVAQDLIRLQMWPVFYDHIHRADQQIFFPATRVGLLVDKPALVVFGTEVKTALDSLIVGLRAPEIVPDSIRLLHPGGGWKKDPGEEKPDPDFEKPEGWTEGGFQPLLPVFETKESLYVNVCLACHAEQIQRRHHCKDWKKLDLTPDVRAEERTVSRWYVKRHFNPGSSQQLLTLIKHLGYSFIYSKKTKRPTTEKLAIEEYARKTKILEHKGYFEQLLKWKEAKKVDGNYVKGTFRRLAQDPRSQKDGRLHGETTHAPSTLRTSMRNPNLQNVTIHGSLSAGFRKCLVAAPGHKLIGSDFSGIEAVLVGWFARDPDYIRLAKLGVHAFLTSHVIGRPADLRMSDSELRQHLKGVKTEAQARPDDEYDKCKRVVHGTSYGLTPYGMAERFPKTFPSRTIAEKIQRLFFRLCPKLKAWQEATKYQADRHHFIGGPGQHPFGYKHWFWDVRSLKPINAAQAKYLEDHGRPWVKLQSNYFKIVEGDDAKRAIAFFPQSTARGVAVEAGLRLTDPECENNLIGWGNDGDTPFRALVHDEWLLEVPDHLVQEAVVRLVREMCRPVKALPLDKTWWPGSETHLSVGVEVFVGQNWDKKSGMEQFDTKGIEVPKVWELVKDLDEVKREEEEADPDEEGYEESAHENAVRVALAG